MIEAPRSEAPVFLIGLGAQKAGTTWLFSYLHGREDADLGFRKEYHIMEAREPTPFFGHWKETRNAALAALSDHEASLPVGEAAKAIVHAAMIVHPPLYLAYFRELAEKPGIRLVGDISPGYNCMPVHLLEQLREYFEARGIRTRGIFLLRDPVRRLQSMVRMNFRRAGIVPEREQELEAIASLADAPYDRRNGAYEEIVPHLDAILGADVHYEFYERLFTHEAIERICAFLDIPYLAADFDHRVNYSEDRHPMPVDMLLRLRGRFAGRYEYCRERFGAELIDELWREPAVASRGG